MLTTFGAGAESARSSSSSQLPPDIIWIDLLCPTDEERTFVEARTRLRIPSIESPSEIESSSRLSANDDVVYLSIPAVTRGDTADAYLSPTGFILTRRVLVTVRFAPLSTFDAVAEQVRRGETLRSAAGASLAQSRQREGSRTARSTMAPAPRGSPWISRHTTERTKK